MHFKDFITKQRSAIFAVGSLIFILSLLISNFIGFASLWGELFIDLAASSLTIIFTALIIDYLNLKEKSDKNQNVANLAEVEIKAICYRINWRLARLFGLEQNNTKRDNISSKLEATKYLDTLTKQIDAYLVEQNFLDDKTNINIAAFEKYLERLQSSQIELEQTIILYEYALSHNLRELILSLRSELQTAERILGFIDSSESLNDANISLIRITAQSIYQATAGVLNYETTK